MSGIPRRVRQGATLTLVFGVVLMAGAASGAWGEPLTVPLPPSMDAAAQLAAGRDVTGADLSPQQAEALVDASGDRWAAYLSPQEYADLVRGRYLGVGLSVDRGKDGSTAVSAVQAGGPAARAGIAAGDRLVAVDGAEADGLPVTEVVARLRGSAHAAVAARTVAVTVSRGSSAPREVVLGRALLAAQEVGVERLPDGVVRIAVRAFTSGVAEQVRTASQGAEAVVLDLRGSSGGLVEEAVATASVFLDGGPVASYESRGVRRELTAARGGDTATPLVVLVDGGTMSAAELLAGALQDRCRAVLVGARTFGKGTVQQPSRLADGGVVELTVGRYYTPEGRSPDGSGLQPDVAAVPEGAGDLALHVLAGLGARR
ncbi:S41 family peptidase [Kitasatospora sp. NPDC085879]|uniref:S41 family peptidase n=1 Tax=Kitasatospora sp. NPDC085879 TaxID=3154769 RepID=UPI003440D29B